MVRFAPMVGTGARLASRSAEPDVERLGDEIAELAAHIHAATWQLLSMLAEFDRREGWANGFRSCAHWLSWRTGIAPGAAREKVRVARALESLPTLGGAMQRGQLSYAKVRAMTRVATPENESELLELALRCTAAQLERIVRAWRRVDRNEEVREERERHAHRKLELWQDDDGSWVLRGRLDPEVGAVLLRALDAAAETLHGRTADPSMSAAQRRADAMGLVAERSLASSPESVRRAERFRVVIHVDADALREDGRTGHAVMDGVRVSAETSRRLGCDAARTVSVQDGTGTTRSGTRTVPTSIRRALERRDGGCRFPGCGLRFCDAHHVRHWADGGATRLDNLVLLCRRHHRAVHEEGFRVDIDAEGDVVFHTALGRRLADAPPAPVLRVALPEKQEHLAITPWTATPDWTGQALDLDWAVAVLHPGNRSRRADISAKPG